MYSSTPYIITHLASCTIREMMAWLAAYCIQSSTSTMRSEQRRRVVQRFSEELGREQTANLSRPAAGTTGYGPHVSSTRSWGHHWKFRDSVLIIRAFIAHSPDFEVGRRKPTENSFSDIPGARVYVAIFLRRKTLAPLRAGTQKNQLLPCNRTSVVIGVRPPPSLLRNSWRVDLGIATKSLFRRVVGVRRSRI